MTGVVAEGPELKRYVDDELGPVPRHDATNSDSLPPALQAYVAADGNKSRAAESLFVQRRTLYFRIERLNSLLGRSVDDSGAREGLSLALGCRNSWNQPSSRTLRGLREPSGQRGVERGPEK